MLSTVHWLNSSVTLASKIYRFWKSLIASPSKHTSLCKGVLTLSVSSIQQVSVNGNIQNMYEGLKHQMKMVYS